MATAAKKGKQTADLGEKLKEAYIDYLLEHGKTPPWCTNS